jgi:hypothetical protein
MVEKSRKTASPAQGLGGGKSQKKGKNRVLFLPAGPGICYNEVRRLWEEITRRRSYYGD